MARITPVIIKSLSRAHLIKEALESPETRRFQDSSKLELQLTQNWIR